MKNDAVLFDEIEQHLLEDEKPSVFFHQLMENRAFTQEPFHIFYRLKQTEQSGKHHPEGNVWIHTMMVVDEAAKMRSQSKEPRCFMWAALLHDIGKPDTTRMRKGRITSYDHDRVGAEIAESFLKKFSDDTAFILRVRNLVRYHMQILFVVNRMPFADIKGMMEHTDYKEIALLGLCDRLGRGKRSQKEEMETIEKFLELCREIPE